MEEQDRSFNVKKNDKLNAHIVRVCILSETVGFKLSVQRERDAKDSFVRVARIPLAGNSPEYQLDKKDWRMISLKAKVYATL